MMTDVTKATISKQFVLAGRASFVTENLKGESITISVKKAEKPKINPKTGAPYPLSYFIKLRHQNESWKYVGILQEKDFTIRLTAKSEFTDADIPYKVVSWVLGIIFSGEDMPDGYRLEHTGRCCKCGKMLRDDESIRLGIGPECIKAFPNWGQE